MTRPDHADGWAPDHLDQAEKRWTREGLIHRVAALEAENERLRMTLEYIAEEYDAGRHDGLREPCPAHDANTMWALARAALDAELEENTDG